MVVEHSDWKGWREDDPLRSRLMAQELSDEDWRYIVNLGLESNPETMLLIKQHEPLPRFDPADSADPVFGECLQAELDFIADVLERRMMEEKCRDSIEESRIALRARLLSPEALNRQIARLHKQLLALGGKKGADRAGQAVENVREAVRQQRIKEQKGVPR